MLGFNIQATGGAVGGMVEAYGLVATEAGEEFSGSYFDGSGVSAYEVGYERRDLFEDVTALPPHLLGPFTGFVAVRGPFLSFPNTWQLDAYWLYRDAAPVPEPAGVALIAAACLGALRLRAFA